MKSAVIYVSYLFISSIALSLISVAADAEEPEGTGSIQWVEPKRWKDLGALAFRLKEIPDQEFTLIFPEWFTSREIGSGARFQWEQTPTTGTWKKDPYSAILKLRYEESDQKRELRWEYRFKNASDQDLTDLAAFNCFNLNGAPLFKDLAMERTWVRDPKGKRVLLKEVPKTQGPGKRTMQFYPAVPGIDLGSIRKIRRYAVTSTACLSGDRMGVVSKDGHWLVETIVEGPVAYFFNNWEADHGCIHAAPLLGTVKPGKTSTAKGRISFTKLK